MQIKSPDMIHLLTKRQRNKNKKKHRFIIIAIILTSLLFTSLFTIGISMIKTVEDSRIKASGSMEHACFKAISYPQYETLKEDSLIKDSSYNIFVSKPKNEKLLGMVTEIRYSEEKAAKWWYCYPETGRMPEAEDELATSTLVLDALGVTTRVGEEVALEFECNGVIYKKVFTLTGFWEGNELAQGQQIWISKSFCNQVVPVSTVSVNEMQIPDYAGTIFFQVFFGNSYQIEESCLKLLERNGYVPEQFAVSINNSYISSEFEIDFMMVSAILGVICFIILIGSLIIYNIFSLMIQQDIQFYGLIKTLGATNRQIKSLVLRQIVYDAMIGIPFGMLLGWSIGKVLLPYLSIFLNGINTVTISANPLIFVFSSIAVFVTICISSIKPSKIANSIDPIKALSYTEQRENDVNKSKSRVKKGKSKALKRMSQVKVTPIYLAKNTLNQQKKKVVRVIITLSLSIILVNALVMLITSMNVEDYTSRYLHSDFYVTDQSIFNSYTMDKKLDSITVDMKEAIEGQDGITEYSEIYAKDFSLELDEEVTKSALNCIDYVANKDKTITFDYWINMIVNNHQMVCKTYGIDEFVFDQLDDLGESIDITKFLSGNYILINTFGEQNGRKLSYYQIGDKVEIKTEDGRKTEYEVLAYAEMPFAYTTHHSLMVQPIFILPSEEFQTHFQTNDMFGLAYNGNKESLESMEEWILDYTTKDYPQLSYESRIKYDNEFDKMRLSFIVIGSVLAIILALIGMMNYVNCIRTSIYSRKKEIAMLEAVGMTNRQQKAMIFYEGAYYVVWTFLVTITAGVGLDYVIVSILSLIVGTSSFHIMIFPIVVLSFVLFLCSYLIPRAYCKKILGESSIERLTK